MQDDERCRVTATLAHRYPVFARSTIGRWVTAEAEKYSDAKIQKYVPILVERSVSATLADLSRPLP